MILRTVNKRLDQIIECGYRRFHFHDFSGEGEDFTDVDGTVEIAFLEYSRLERIFYRLFGWHGVRLVVAFKWFPTTTTKPFGSGNW